jgi:hypothetical protein
MSESLRCFTYLLENAPVWIKNVEELEHRIKDRQSEIARIPVPVTKQKIRKSGSTESIRPGKHLDEDSGGGGSSTGHHIEVTSAPQDNDMANPQTTRQFLMGSQRKRKTTSVISSLTAPNAKYRQRSMIIVYYDSIVQESFNSLVQNISGGRNHLRKAKMAARMEALTRGVSYDTSDADKTSRRTAYETTSLPALPNFRSARGFPPRPDPFANGSPGNSPNGATSHDPLSAADKALETAQSFCEKGAHQFLRDGDCLHETAGARASFHDVLILARQQTEKLQEEEMLRNERRRMERERRERELAAFTMDRETRGSALQLDERIEADSGDESEEDFDDPANIATMLPPFRLTART